MIANLTVRPARLPAELAASLVGYIKLRRHFTVPATTAQSPAGSAAISRAASLSVRRFTSNRSLADRYAN